MKASVVGVEESNTLLFSLLQGAVSKPWGWQVKTQLQNEFNPPLKLYTLPKCRASCGNVQSAQPTAKNTVISAC